MARCATRSVAAGAGTWSSQGYAWRPFVSGRFRSSLSHPLAGRKGQRGPVRAGRPATGPRGGDFAPRPNRLTRASVPLLYTVLNYSCTRCTTQSARSGTLKGGGKTARSQTNTRKGANGARATLRGCALARCVRRRTYTSKRCGTTRTKTGPTKASRATPTWRWRGLPRSPTRTETLTAKSGASRSGTDLWH